MQLSDNVDKVLEALEWAELSVMDFLVAILSNTTGAGLVTGS